MSIAGRMMASGHPAAATIAQGMKDQIAAKKQLNSNVNVGATQMAGASKAAVNMRRTMLGR